jgi:sugar O-acyltransferase (sialic acid O-acetyltransferase NeuD family)
MEKIILCGASGNANDVLDILEAINQRQPTWQVAGFLDDSLQRHSYFMDWEVLGRLSDAVQFADCKFINCIGSERTHRMRSELIGKTGLPVQRFATLVHPMASMSARASVGYGVYVSFGCSVGGGASLEDHVSLGPRVIVGHDSRIERGSMLAAGSIVSGFATVGAASYLGAGCAVKQMLCIGEQSLIGMGAVVTRDVAPGVTVVGNPARPFARSNASAMPFKTQNVFSTHRGGLYENDL